MVVRFATALGYDLEIPDLKKREARPEMSDNPLNAIDVTVSYVDLGTLCFLALDTLKSMAAQGVPHDMYAPLCEVVERVSEQAALAYNLTFTGPAGFADGRGDLP
jgi:hypothetical protein